MTDQTNIRMALAIETVNGEIEIVDILKFSPVKEGKNIYIIETQPIQNANLEHGAGEIFEIKNFNIKD